MLFYLFLNGNNRFQKSSESKLNQEQINRRALMNRYFYPALPSMYDHLIVFLIHVVNPWSHITPTVNHSSISSTRSLLSLPLLLLLLLLLLTLTLPDPLTPSCPCLCIYVLFLCVLISFLHLHCAL